MPREKRQLKFEPDEFIAAVREYHNLRGEFWVGRAKVAHIHFEELPEVAADIGFSEEGRSLRLTSEMITAALIVYCINHKVPLPAHGQKSVRVADGRIELVVAVKASANRLDHQKRHEAFRTPESQFLTH